MEARRQAAPAAAGGGRVSALGGLLRRALALLVLSIPLTLLLAAGVPRLQTDASVGLLVDESSPAYQDQARFAETFGGDPVVVELEAAPGQALLTPDHLVGLAALEGSLSRAPGVKRVYGPGTLVNTFAQEVTRRALDLCASQGTQAEQKAAADARAAGKPAADVQAAGQAAFNAAVRACAQRLAAQYPSLGVPALNNPTFYQEVLLEPDGQTVRPFWLSMLPDANHAVISVRMAPNASESAVREVLDRVNRSTTGATAGAQPIQRTASGARLVQPTTAEYLYGTKAATAGAPALTVSLADSVRNSLVYLLPLTLVAMLLVSVLVIRVPYRLAAVPVAILAGLWTAGAAGWLHLPLTPATLAVLPVVLGLATDYTIQTANRLAEEPGEPAERVRRAAGAILPATGVAALATAAGVLAFAVSPIPLVRQFALFMALGVAMAYLASVLLLVPALALVAGRPRLGFLRGPSRPEAPRWERLAAWGALPRAAVLTLAAVGLLGWAALPFLKIETDPGRLMPPGSAALAQADHVRQTVGLSGELDLVVAGPDTSSPEVVAWLDAAARQAAGGDLKALVGLPAFLAAFNSGQPADTATTKLILDRIPPYFSRAVISGDRKLAVSVFGITRLTSVEEDQALVARLQRAAGSPPAGYRAYPAGLAVLASQALGRMRQDQVLLNVLALALVLAVLTLAYRRPRPALLAVLPAAAAAGWATGLLFLTGSRSSPITVLLAGVVVAFATEFSVLWLARYRREVGAGAGPTEASAIASGRVGPAIVASALALAIGFAVLGVSPVPMVRDFGLWSAADLLLATVAVLVLLPPAARAWLRG